MPTWAWIALGILVLLVVLALIDYFVTNVVFNRAPATAPGRTDDPFAAQFGALQVLGTAFLLSFTRRP
jgi:hypothetical protein